MLGLGLWWQGFLTAIGLYFVFVLGQVIGFYKKTQNEEQSYNNKEW